MRSCRDRRGVWRLESAPMNKYIAGYAATALVLLALDLVFIGYIAMPIYQSGIGHLLAAQPSIPAAVAFYIVFTLGLMMFAVVPTRTAPGWSKTATAAALFGFFTYATYDLTNLATLRDWPLHIVGMDLVWGCLVSAAAGSAGRAAMKRFPA